MRKRPKRQEVAEIQDGTESSRLRIVIRRLGWAVVGGVLIGLGALLGAWGLLLPSHATQERRQFLLKHGTKSDNPRAYMWLAGLGLPSSYLHAAPDGFFGMGLTGMDGPVDGRQRWGIGVLGELLVLLGNMIGGGMVAGLALAVGMPSWGNGTMGKIMLNLAQSTLDQGFGLSLAAATAAGALMWVVVAGSRFASRGLLGSLSGTLSGFALVALIILGLWHASVAAFFFIAGLLLKLLAPAAFWVSIGSAPEAYVDLLPETFLLHSLLPLAMGNLIGIAGLESLVRRFQPSRRPSP